MVCIGRGLQRKEPTEFVAIIGLRIIKGQDNEK
ncbi:hypothetical protein SMETH2_28880 [Serratia marcescens]|nr:hypothetical protein AF54_02383 [Serratia marcescens BIDMC 81]BEN02757.1 hypothetical protein SMETH2_28880 [Serratia marcescens]BEN74773.1 hypothetical protein SMKC081_29180 [Serratia marcescens]